MTPSEYAAAVAAEVRAEMGRQNKGQVDLALALGTSRPTAARRMSGDVPFDMAQLMKIALWLGVPVETFSPELGDVPA